ncbi:aminotransferase class I/II-fold pyridoxal phosphate-dependent enzyme [uncultured Draconibacterium sp.]|uniref:pyridoxal phosphate-dependent decarboxylase family protein n=1 Tax=uncultured Draconibacterium sp. TaxID=1573823 RepID=UPI0029C707B7|nr:aminotransferase class I/II-fold pyridoxal phosphate-dependent enzyme [uncultured Draconibacterium sp.]
MNKIWERKTQEEIRRIIMEALKGNADYEAHEALGIPASYLDNKVFNKDESFLSMAPFMYAMSKNPNHIGCHTLGTSESFFKGTQAIERELLDICAVDILQGKEGEYDGYVASGGTEANIEAVWIYRNLFKTKHRALNSEIAIVCSEDTHYSLDKAGNLLGLDVYKLPVDERTRELNSKNVETVIKEAMADGKKHFIVNCNMMTTMFGSVDDIDRITSVLTELNCSFKLHVDGAYGGFYYPFSDAESKLTFKNPHISSFTLDAHKMAQAPYGTGIFLVRKNLIENVNTKEASYVEGQDYTLIGSRSGANAIAAWMILSKYGPHGWFEKILILQNRTAWLCNELEKIDIAYFRNQHSNIVTVDASQIDIKTVSKFGLVPDNHHNPKWYKIVVMEHVEIEKLKMLVDDLKK